FEVGYRTTLFDKLYVDAGYYYSIYDNFLGFRVGVDLDYTTAGGPITIQQIQAFRYAANSTNQVTTQGFSLGLNYYLWQNYTVNGNYSFNRLNRTFPDDPIIPAFNTPEHKFNFGFAGRNLRVPGNFFKTMGFSINYKWIEGFLFEGSPQFTGFVPTYDMLDAQVNFSIPSISSILKIGASNVLDNQQFQTYGGPRIGRLAYISLTYEPGSVK
ncbi:MAG: TonB-dependent receptor, partial [Bacteroidota bacterium]